MHTLSQLKDLFRKENIRATKRFGQNFLIDKNNRDRIVSACNITKNDSIIEIGPGLGALTSCLSAQSRQLIAVEVDKKLYPFLKTQFSSCKNVSIVHSDILKFDIKEASKKDKCTFKVIGNLPYYITSPIITYLIDNRECIDSAFITVQKEVADRLVSQPGTKDYGSLSCYTQFYTKPEIMFRIPNKVFYPQPTVASALVKLEFFKIPPIKVKNELLFFKIINAAFNKRRKTILNALSNIVAEKKQVNEILLDAGIEPNRRGETLSLNEFARIEEGLENLNEC